MIEFVRNTAVRWVFGGGFGATLADRGLDWLAEESRKAIGNEPEDLTGAKIRPGETYTVIARPPATRAERKLAKASSGLAEADRRMGVPTRRQRRAARNLRSVQRRLDRSRPGTRRRRRAVVAERELGRRFDTVIAPSERHRRIRSERRRIDAELEASRAASFASVARSGDASATFYD